MVGQSDGVTFVVGCCEGAGEIGVKSGVEGGLVKTLS